MFGLVGFGGGLAVLALLWFPHSVVEWFVASLVPGVIAFRLAAVPPGYSPPRAFGIFAGLWAALFWVPVVVFLGQQLGLIA